MSHLVFVFSHYFLILHILLHDKVCLLNNFAFLVIINLIVGTAFITGLFTCFINVIAYFLSISEHFSTIISPELCLLNLDKFFQPIFTNSAPLGRVGHRVAMSVCVSVCLSVPSRNTHFRRSCRPLVEDRVPNIGLG